MAKFLIRLNPPGRNICRRTVENCPHLAGGLIEFHQFGGGGGGGDPLESCFVNRD